MYEAYSSAPILGSHTLDRAIFLVLPAAVVTIAAVFLLDADDFARDFDTSFWPAANEILHGRTPYVTANSAAFEEDSAFAYPAFAGLLFAPFGLIPKAVAGIAFTVVSLAALVLALRIMGVRDPRVFGAVMLWSPTFTAWQTANVTLVMALGLACVWRFRERPVVSGVVVAVLVSLKLFLWPLIMWLLITKRYRAVGWSLASMAATNLVAWSIVGFGEISRWLDLTNALADRQAPRGYGFPALVDHLGGARDVGWLVSATVVIGLLAVALRAARQRQEGSAFALAITAGLASSPILWPHYLVLMVVPLALRRPTFGGVWLFLVVFWMCPPIDASTTEVVIGLLAAGAVVAVAATRAYEPRVTPPVAAPT